MRHASDREKEKILQKITSNIELKPVGAVELREICWIWGFTKSRCHYPRLNVNLRDRIYFKGNRALCRLIYFWFNSWDLPGEGNDVSHRCHVRKCVNPGHLTLESRDHNNLRKLCKREGRCLCSQFPGKALCIL